MNPRNFDTIVRPCVMRLKTTQCFFVRARQVKNGSSPMGPYLPEKRDLSDVLRTLANDLGIESPRSSRAVRMIAELLSISDACVLSSKAEGFSNSTEYMAAARPVVATDVGGAREAVIENETGHLDLGGR